MPKEVSTYMNEMIEVCSLGRGTSTKDGVAISTGIIQYIWEDLRCYCLFATHFYELTKLEEHFKNLKNYLLLKMEK